MAEFLFGLIIFTIFLLLGILGLLGREYYKMEYCNNYDFKTETLVENEMCLTMFCIFVIAVCSFI